MVKETRKSSSGVKKIKEKVRKGSSFSSQEWKSLKCVCLYTDVHSNKILYGNHAWILSFIHTSIPNIYIYIAFT